MQRKRYSKAFKAQVAIAAIKGQKTANELASAYEIPVSQINDWKKQALAALPEVFGQRQHRAAEEREAERDRLYQQIGKLQVEVAWLKIKGYVCVKCWSGLSLSVGRGIAEEPPCVPKTSTIGYPKPVNLHPLNANKRLII